MDQKSQMKVMKAGFIILRKDDQPSPRIKQKTEFENSWRTHSKYATKAARDREFEKLLKDDATIQD